ncbi:MAG TPA: hypothetical protein PLX97_09465 [Gemmatales bacterium]|nr:hypothetical protein [Gemmatales bacterium]
MKRSGVTAMEYLILLALIVVLFFAMMGRGIFLFSGLFHLVAGWVYYVAETWPRVQLRWAGVATFVIGTALIVVLTQYFCRWLAPERQWRWSWTIKCLAIILLAFAAGICAVGMVHQVGWLASSRELLLRNRSITNFTFSTATDSAIVPVPSSPSNPEKQP